MTYQAIRPAEFPWFRYDGYTFSLGLARTLPDGRTEAVLSGHSASEYDPEAGRIVVKGGMKDQVRTAYAKIAAILGAVGLGFADVTRVVENFSAAGLADYVDAEAVRREVFGEHLPPASTVVVDALLRRDARVEIEVRAVTGGGGATPIADRILRVSPEGEVYVPTALPLGPSGEKPVDQYRRCVENAAGWLEKAGLGLGAVVAVRETVSADVLPGEVDEMRRLRRELLGPDGLPPASSTVVVAGLGGHAQVTLDVVASVHPPRAVFPDGWGHLREMGWTPAIRAGDMLFLSGFDGRDPATGEAAPRDDVVAQAEAAYRAVRTVLAAEGLGPEALCETVEYVTTAGLPAYRGVAGVRQRLLRGDADRDPVWPASTGLVCAELPRPGARFLVLPTAVAG